MYAAEPSASFWRAVLDCQSGVWKKQGGFTWNSSTIYTAFSAGGSPAITCPAGSFVTSCTATNLGAFSQNGYGTISGNTCYGSPSLQGVYAVCVSVN